MTQDDAYRAMRNAYKSTFISEHGRVVFQHLLEQCGFFEPAIAPGEEDSAVIMAFRDGRRSVCCEIWRMLYTSDHDIDRMFTHEPTRAYEEPEV